MIGEFQDDGFVRRFRKQSISYGQTNMYSAAPSGTYTSSRDRKRLRMKTHFLEQPAAEIPATQYVTTPATNKTPEDERRQNCQAKKDEARVTNPFCSVYIVSEGSMAKPFCHEPPLDDVRDQ